MVSSEATPVSASIIGAVVERQSTDTLLKWLTDGTMEFDDERDDDTPTEREARRRRRSTLLSDKDESKQAYIKYWRDIIRAVDRRLPRGLKTAKAVVDGAKTNKLVLEILLSELAITIGEKYFGKPGAASVSQYYRMRQRLIAGDDPRDLSPNTSARGNREQILPEVKRILRQTTSEKLEEARHKSRKGAKPVVTMNDIMVTTLERIDDFKARHPQLADRAHFPSKTTFYNVLNEAPKYLRDLAIRGSANTRKDYRRPFGHTEPEACLSEVQYDETRLDVYCFCDVYKIPLGRPWLAWLVDVFSGGILGFYLGFEPPGDVVFGSVLRHASLPKTYVCNAYPDITSPYLMSGVPRFVTFDNSLSAHGDTIDRILSDLDVPWDFTLSRMPWLKPYVENSFGLLNKSLLRELPGYVLSRDIDRSDYDPTVNGCIGFLHLLWIVHKWLLEVYHANPPLNGGVASPNVRWMEGTRLIRPQYPRTGQDLDTLFGIVREGVTLDHRGVLFQGLRYYSDGADLLRYENGPNIKVKIKVNPCNLLVIHVFDPKRDCWTPCTALDREYATGLDLHRHILYDRHAVRISGNSDLESRIRARSELHRMIRSAIPDALGLRTNGLIARTLGIGTHTVFNHLDHSGHLPSLQGHFGGTTPLPTSPLVTSASLPAPPDLIPPAEPSTEPVINSSIVTRRQIPRFATSRLPQPSNWESSDDR
jgi:hypothetical protein